MLPDVVVIIFNHLRFRLLENFARKTSIVIIKMGWIFPLQTTINAFFKFTVFLIVSIYISFSNGPERFFIAIEAFINSLIFHSWTTLPGSSLIHENPQRESWMQRALRFSSSTGRAGVIQNLSFYLIQYLRSLMQMPVNWDSRSWKNSEKKETRWSESVMSEFHMCFLEALRLKKGLCGFNAVYWFCGGCWWETFHVTLQFHSFSVGKAAVAGAVKDVKLLSYRRLRHYCY